MSTLKLRGLKWLVQGQAPSKKWQNWDLNSVWSLICCFVCLFWPHHMECRLSVPRPGIEPSLSLLEVWMLNHWTSREIPLFCFVFSFQLYVMVPGHCQRSMSSSLLRTGQGTCCFVLFSASPLSLSKHISVQPFFRWFAFSLLHYIHKWVILPASYTSSPFWVPSVHRY